MGRRNNILEWPVELPETDERIDNYKTFRSGRGGEARTYPFAAFRIEYSRRIGGPNEQQ